MAISFDNALGLHPQALFTRTQRAEVLANNIANADTPGYKARDFDFVSALQTEHAKSTSLKTTHTAHQSGFEMPAINSDLQYRNSLQPSIDGNTVDSLIEQAEFMRNSLKFQASFTFLNGKFSGLTRAIKGQ